MSFFNLAKVGTLFASYQAYFPSLIDTSDLVGWPWTLTCFSSTDHISAGNGVYMVGAVGDPTIPANWETYDTALARGAFAAFATKPVANPIYVDADLADSETPSVVRVGDQFYLTSHGLESGTWQTTRLAIASDFPLNFVRYENGNSGRVLDNSVEPLLRYPHYQHHTGYFRWSANNLPGVPYSYIGFGLFGSGDQPNHAMYGSDDAVSWNMLSVRHESPNIPGVLSDRIFSWNESAPGSIRSVGNGEYVMLVALTNKASGNTTRYSDCYEITLSADGTKMTRTAALVLGRGGSGAPDEYEIGQPAVVEYGGSVICVYQGATGAVNSLMLAVGSFNPSASKTTPIAERNFTTQRYDALNAASLPSWLSVVGTAPTPTATGLTVPGASGIRYNSDITPSDYGWIEVYVEQAGEGTAALPILHIGDTAGPSDPENGICALSYSGIDDTQVRIRAGAVSVLTSDIGFPWYKNSPNKSRVGLQWDTATDTVKTLGYNRELISVTDASGTATNGIVRPGFYVNTAGTSIKIAAFEVRKGALSGGVAPVVASGVVLTTAIQFTLNKACLGDGAGISVTANGLPVAGTWSRGSLTALTFTRSAGEFVESDSVVVTVASTDLRSVADLVAVQYTTYNDLPWGGSLPQGEVLYMAIYLASDPAPTWGRYTGWSGSPVYTDMDASPAISGAYTFAPDSSGLDHSTTYRWYAVWDDGTTTVGPIGSASFTTLTVVEAAAPGAALTGSSSIAAGAAVGSSSAEAPGSTLTGSSSIEGGGASGMSDATAPGAAMTGLATLDAGVATGTNPGAAPGATLTGLATIDPGTAQGNQEALAPGATLSGSGQLIPGLANDGTDIVLESGSAAWIVCPPIRRWIVKPAPRGWIIKPTINGDIVPLPTKDPDEIKTVTFDFSADAVTLTDATVTPAVVQGLHDNAPENILGEKSVTGWKVLQRVKAGKDGTGYALRCKAVDADGEVHVAVALLPVKTASPT